MRVFFIVQVVVLLAGCYDSFPAEPDGDRDLAPRFEDSYAEMPDPGRESVVEFDARTDTHEPRCGNGMLDPGEECDGDVVRPCVSPCDTSGASRCTTSCTFGECEPPPETCNGTDDDCDTLYDEDCPPAASSVAPSSPGPSCSDEYGRLGTIVTAGCATVTITGTFHNDSDARDGQVYAAASDDASFELTWDDAPAGDPISDCDPDVTCRTRWTTTSSIEGLLVTVTHEVTAREAAAVLRCGYRISGHDPVWLSGIVGESDTRSFGFPCAP